MPMCCFFVHSIRLVSRQPSHVNSQATVLDLKRSICEKHPGSLPQRLAEEVKKTRSKGRCSLSTVIVDDFL